MNSYAWQLEIESASPHRPHDSQPRVRTAGCRRGAGSIASGIAEFQHGGRESPRKAVLGGPPYGWLEPDLYRRPGSVLTRASGAHAAGLAPPLRVIAVRVPHSPERTQSAEGYHALSMAESRCCHALGTLCSQALADRCRRLTLVANLTQAIFLLNYYT